MWQKPIGDFIVDFFCSKLKLVLEVDGNSHDGKEKKDQERQMYLKSLGLTVLRFEDQIVKQDLNSVISEIKKWVIK